MLKEKLFKFLFPKKAAEIEDLFSREIEALHLSNEYRDRFLRLSKELDHLKRKESTTKLTEDQFMQYCLDTLNVPWLNFANVDDAGRPPHYLAGLTPEARKDFVAHMESMYADEKFQTVVSYVINLIGNHSIQKAEDDKMKNGKIGIVGIRTLMSEFINAHKEYVDSRKSGDDFDKLAIMPE